MRRAAWIGVAAVGTGIVLGAGALVVARDPSPTLPAGEHGERTGATTSSEGAVAPGSPTLLVWTSGGLPPGFPERVRPLDGVEEVTVVSGDLIDLARSFDESGRPVDTAPPGMHIPLDAIAYDPSTYPPFVDQHHRNALTRLGSREALLGTTSARLRRLGPGGVLELADGQRVTVTGVVDDSAVGAAELVVASPDATAVGITTPRFLLLTYSGERAATEQAIAALLPDTPVRFRAPEEASFLRHADLVLPQAHIKERFGEFAYAPGTNRFVVLDPAYIAAHIVTAGVPILGSVTCHRDVIDALTSALRELEARGLASLVDPAGYQGCWVPSTIPQSGELSHHTWGVAIDVNFAPNPTGLPSYVDQRLIEIMDRWGFISGAHFLQVDPGHFEYVRPPG